MKAVVSLFAILTTGLSAGLFYAWAVSVIPGTKNIPDKSYLEAMQAINKAILNPGFFIIFFGALLLMSCSAYLQFKTNTGLPFWMIICGVVAYLAGTIGVTVFGNVPMNETLDLVNLNALSMEELKLTRQSYEGRWNKFHMLRTLFSVASFILLIMSVLYANHTATDNIIQ